jgi:3-dehydroquinate synthase
MVELLMRANLPTSIPDYIDREALVKKLYTDKKVRDGKLRFVIQDGIGSIATFGEEVYATPISEELAREIIMEL